MLIATLSFVCIVRRKFRSEFQQLVDVFEGGLGSFDRCVYRLQSFVEACGIAAYFNGYALDSACHLWSPPLRGYEKYPE